MISPRPSLSATTSNECTSSSEAEISEDEVVSVPTQTTVSVGSIVVQPEATMPGVLLGTLNNTYVNLLVNPGIGRRTGDIRPEDLNDLVTDAVKINSETVKSFIPTDINSSSNKLTGTKEDVEGLSRRWCYLITALVTLSLITLLGTAVLSLTSWRTSQSSIIATNPTDATRATIEGLSAEEKHFAEIPNGPRIVTRQMWLAAPSRRPWDRNTLPVTTVIVCYTATGNCTSQPECISKMRAMQRYQQETRRFADLGYNFLIGGDGSVYWARGFDFVGEHTHGFNHDSIAVAFIGTFIAAVPNESQIEAFKKLLIVGVKEGKIAPDYTLVAQCQLVVTSAPGLALVNTMTSWPHFNSSLPIRCSVE